MPKTAKKKAAKKQVAAKPEVQYSKNPAAQSLKESRAKKGMA